MFSEKQFLRKIDICISAVSCYVTIFKPVLPESYQREKTPTYAFSYYNDTDHEGAIRLT